MLIIREKRKDGVRRSHTLPKKGERMKTTADEIRETIIILCRAFRDTSDLSPNKCAKVADTINSLSAALINAVTADKIQGEVEVAPDIDGEALAKEEGTEDDQHSVRWDDIVWPWQLKGVQGVKSETTEDGQRTVEGYLVQWSGDGGDRYSQFRGTIEAARDLADTLAGFSYRGLTISEVHIGETVWESVWEGTEDGHRVG